MKNSMSLLLVLIFLTGCSMQKSTSKQDERISANNLLTLNSISKIKTSDSIAENVFLQKENEYEIYIQPKGKFTYSKEKGFEGEANTLTLKGKYTATQLKRLNKFKLTEKQESKSQSLSKKMVAAKSGKLVKPNQWLYLVLITIGLIGIIYFIRRSWRIRHSIFK